MNDTTIVILIVAVVALIIVLSWLPNRAQRPPPEDQVQQVVQDAVREAAQHAGPAAVSEYQRRENELREAAAAKRREAAARAKETRAKRIEALQPWRKFFVMFVQRLARPYFDEWGLDNELLSRWAEGRADYYISKKPYVLEIIQSIHADAQHAAQNYVNLEERSSSEIARAKAVSKARTLVRNDKCPYCGDPLGDSPHLDHIVSVKRGGPSSDWNLVFVCIPCNRAKRGLSLKDFSNSEYAQKRGLTLKAIVDRLEELDKFVEIEQEPIVSYEFEYEEPNKSD